MNTNRSDHTDRRTWLFEEAPVSRAVWTLAVPTIITQLINIIYNYADTWYVGRTGDAAMVAALSVCSPVYILLAAVANLFGIGGSSVISRSLGMKKPERARHTFAFCFYAGIAAAVVFLMIILLFREPIIMAIGGDAGSLPYAMQYMFWTMIIGAIPSIGNVLCGHLIRSIGAAKEAGFGMSMGGILNIILDPLFMFVILPPGMEVMGAGIATMLSNTAAFVYFLWYLVRHRDNPVFTLRIRDVSFDDRIPQDVLNIGFPAAMSTTLAMVSNMFANRLVAEYGSEAVAGMGVAKKINMIAFNTCMGMTQGILPLLGYSYGAKNYERMKQVTRYSLRAVLTFGICCNVVFYVFAPQLISFFISEPVSVSYGSMFMRVISFAASLASISYLVNAVFQAAGRRTESLLLSSLRKGILDIPGMFLFRHFLGVIGVVVATPVAEVLGVIIATLMYRNFRKKLQ